MAVARRSGVPDRVDSSHMVLRAMATDVPAAARVDALDELRRLGVEVRSLTASLPGHEDDG
jgi:hypothetical protein